MKMDANILLPQAAAAAIGAGGSITFPMTGTVRTADLDIENARINATQLSALKQLMEDHSRQQLERHNEDLRNNIKTPDDLPALPKVEKSPATVPQTKPATVKTIDPDQVE
jgi:hypothetical protein